MLVLIILVVQIRLASMCTTDTKIITLGLGQVTFHGMEIVAPVTSGVIVRTIPKVKVKDVQMVG